jgi:hypothetical protein
VINRSQDSTEVTGFAFGGDTLISGAGAAVVVSPAFGSGSLIFDLENILSRSFYFSNNSLNTNPSNDKRENSVIMFYLPLRMLLLDTFHKPSFLERLPPTLFSAATNPVQNQSGC